MANRNVSLVRVGLGQGQAAGGVDPKLSDQPSYALNGVFAIGGEFRKRKGTTDLSGPSVSTKGMFAVNGEPYRFGPGLYRVKTDGTADTFFESPANVDASSRPIISSQTQAAYGVDSVKFGNYLVTASTVVLDGDNIVILCSVEDYGTGRIIDERQLYDGGNTRVNRARVVSDGSACYVAWADADGGELDVKRVAVNPSNGSIGTALAVPTATTNNHYAIDAMVDSSGDLVVAFLNSSDVIAVSLASGTTDTVTISGDSVVAFCLSPWGGDACLSWVEDDGAGGYDYKAALVDLSSGVSIGTVYEIGSSAIGAGASTAKIGAAELSSTVSHIWVSVPRTTLGTDSYETQAFSFETDGSFSALATVTASGDIVARPFIYEGKSYALCSVGVEGDRTAVLFDSDGGIVGSCLQQLSVRQNSGLYVISRLEWMLPGITQLSAQEYGAPSLVEDGVEAGSNAVMVLLDMDAGVGRTHAYDGAVIVPGSIPRVLRGAEFGSAGFFGAPAFSAANAGTGSALTSGASYGYKACWARVSADGATWRGPMSDTVTLVSSGEDVTITAQSIPESEYDDVALLVYRTVGDSLTFGLVATMRGISRAGDGTIENATFTDDTTDAVLDSALNEGSSASPPDEGLFPSPVPWPSHRAGGISQGRYWIAPRLRESTEVWYSLELKRGVSVRFEGSRNVVQVPSPGGRIVAIEEYLDKTLILKESAVYVVDGVLKDDEGQGSGPRVWLVDASRGCISDRSVIKSENGVYWQSQEGIVRLSSRMVVEPIGISQRYITDRVNITGAFEVSDNTLVWTSDDEALAYNYVFGAWSVFSGHEADSGACYDGSDIWFCDSGVAHKQQSNQADTRSAVDAWVTTKLVTQWINAAGIGGEWRFKGVRVIGHALSGCKLVVGVGYDYDPTFKESHEFDASALESFGPDAYYDGTDLGASYQRQAMIARFQPFQTRCTCARVSVSDAPPESWSPSASMGISLTLAVIEAMGVRGAHRANGRAGTKT